MRRNITSDAFLNNHFLYFSKQKLFLLFSFSFCSVIFVFLCLNLVYFLILMMLIIFIIFFLFYFPITTKIDINFYSVCVITILTAFCVQRLFLFGLLYDFLLHLCLQEHNSLPFKLFLIIFLYGISLVLYYN